MTQVHNFNAGPAVLPRPVLLEAQEELLDFRGTGMSIMEISHRSSTFEAVMAETEAGLREALGIPPAYQVLFLQGGASLQFAMLPMNLMTIGLPADYIVNGAWGTAALKEAQKLGPARLAGSSENTGFDRTPQNLELSPRACLPALHLQRDHPRRAVPGRASLAPGCSAGLRYVLRLSQPPG